MKKSALLLVSIILLMSVSCQQKKKQDTPQNQNEIELSEKQTPKLTSYSVDEVLNDATSFIDKEIIIKGYCTHICAHTKRKLFLDNSDHSQTLRVEPKENAPYKDSFIEKEVSVYGYLVEDRIDEAYLNDWEEQIATNSEEIHGKEDGGGCATEKKARQETANTSKERIADFRKKIQLRYDAEGIDYLSFYHFVSTKVEITN